jgi:hypothetical protein
MNDVPRSTHSEARESREVPWETPIPCTITTVGGRIGQRPSRTLRLHCDRPAACPRADESAARPSVQTLFMTSKVEERSHMGSSAIRMPVPAFVRASKWIGPGVLLRVTGFMGLPLTTRGQSAGSAGVALRAVPLNHGVRVAPGNRDARSLERISHRRSGRPLGRPRDGLKPVAYTDVKNARIDSGGK